MHKHKHRLNKRNRLKPRLKAEKKKRSLKEYLKAKAPRLYFLFFVPLSQIYHNSIK